jgi:predicted lipoprotein with Yx(FWY)xxD motif
MSYSLARAKRNHHPYSDLEPFSRSALMRSIRLSVGVTAGVLATLLLAACGGTTSSGTGGTPATSSTALIHTASMKVGDKTLTVLKDPKGLTLYYFTPDTATTVACTGGCASNWPPLTATSGTPTSTPALPGQLTVMKGANGNQVLYNGHPLYTYVKDGDAGDAYGQGVGGKWFVATPGLAAAAAVKESPPAY